MVTGAASPAEEAASQDLYLKKSWTFLLILSDRV
jgi:hypothetical protein